jgi:H+/Cl- antiporter ClcA
MLFVVCSNTTPLARAPCCSNAADVQAYLNGVEHPVFKNFFTVKTFVAKVIGSSLAVGSSLVMGKEGPMLHAGSILAVILGEIRLWQLCLNWADQQLGLCT